LKRQKTGYLAAWILAAAIGAGLPLSAQVRIGYVNSEKIISAYKPAVDAQKKLAEFRDSVIQEMNRMQEEIRNTQETLKTQSMMLTPAAKDKKEQELQNLVVQIQQFEQDKNQELVTKNNELLKPVYDQITASIKKIGESQNYDFIFDIIQGNLLWAKDKHDITDSLISTLEKEKPGSVVKTGQ